MDSYRNPGNGGLVDPEGQRQSKPHSIAHGDTKGSKALVDDNKMATVTDSGPSNWTLKSTLCNKFIPNKPMHQYPNMDHRNLELCTVGIYQQLPDHQQKYNDRSERSWSIYGQSRSVNKMRDSNLPARSCTVEAWYGLNLGTMSPSGGEDSWNGQSRMQLGGHYEQTRSQGYSYGGDYHFTTSGYQQIFV